MFWLNAILFVLFQHHHHDGAPIPIEIAPEGICWRWDANLIALFTVGNALIGTAYFAISGGLIVLARLLNLRAVWNVVIVSFWAFASFILLCGAGHFIDIATIWTGWFYFKGWTNLLTAFVSVIVCAGFLQTVYLVATNQVLRDSFELTWQVIKISSSPRTVAPDAEQNPAHLSVDYHDEIKGLIKDALVKVRAVNTRLDIDVETHKTLPN